MLGLLRGHTVSGALDYKLRKAVLHSGHLWAAPIMAEPGSRIHGQPEYSCWHFWTGAAGRWELLSERGMPPPPPLQRGQASHIHKKTEWALDKWGRGSGVAWATAAAGRLGNMLMGVQGTEQLFMRTGPRSGQVYIRSG
jgi:hypothetical protein